MTTVFGTEMVVLTFIITCIELFILVFQSINFLARPKDRSRKRFLLLVLFFVCYNICSGLLPDVQFNLHLLLQNALAYGSGIALGVYYYYFQTEELGLKLTGKLTWKNLLIGLLGSFFIGYILTYLFFEDFTLAKHFFIGIPILMALYFCYKTILAIRSTKLTQEFKVMYYSGYAGVVFMTTMPIVFAFGDYQAWNNGLVNVSFLFTAFAVIYRHVMKARKEELLLATLNNVVVSIDSLPNFELTKREQELLELLAD
jgi:uncharacterized membrane protein YdcZ (DUF606 family)